ncbi:hypothetical protein PAXRUDRAFT_181096, partial [Paxillus rubicundulus Ve08.2h10]
TMLLAMAIWWGTSHITSEYHMRQYKQYMKVYLKCVKTIFLEIGWQPNHHASLHLDKFLHRYGPMHGWWMFPFERVIGSLQKMNMNHKIGQLEQTMLGAFCAAARLKALLQHPNAPNVIRDVSNMLKVCCSASDDGTLAVDISIFHTLTQTGETNWTVDGDAKVEEAPALVKRALLAAGIEGCLDGQLNMFSRCTVSGIKYST